MSAYSLSALKASVNGAMDDSSCSSLWCCHILGWRQARPAPGV